ncbi:MAG: chemotaxis protein CheX [Oligoflexus sp.]
MKKTLSKHNILVLRAKKELTNNIQWAIEKFHNIHGIQVQVTNSNVNMAAEKIESGKVNIIFCETLMEKAEANFFSSCLETSKDLPYIICSTDNYEKIRKVVPPERIYRQKGEFSTSFLFNCIRNLLTPPNHKIDIRYIKSILMSVIDVIQKNTGLALQPDPITEFKQRELPEDFLSTVAFYGDGFLGSISVKARRTLVQKFAEKIFFTEESFDDDTLIDLLGEMSHQILGVAKNSLKDFGYELRNSLQIVCSGDQFLYDASSSGRYYEIPFRLDGEFLNITFCYNTYRTTLQELGVTEEKQNVNRFDIRLLSLIGQSIEDILKSNLQIKVQRTGLEVHKSAALTSNSFHIFHAGGWQGEISLGLDVPADTCSFIKEKMIGDAEFDVSTINDLIKELLNQIGGDFLKKSKEIGYNFQRIYQGSFSQKGELKHLLKSPGYVLKMTFMIEDQSFHFYFGSRSDTTSPYFDVWPFIQSPVTPLSLVAGEAS